MSERILVVGGVAGGASTAARIRRLDEHAEIIMFEKSPHVSYSNCGLPYHISGLIENTEDLVLMTQKYSKRNITLKHVLMKLSVIVKKKRLL